MEARAEESKQRWLCSCQPLILETIYDGGCTTFAVLKSVASRELPKNNERQHAEWPSHSHRSRRHTLATLYDASQLEGQLQLLLKLAQFSKAFFVHNSRAGDPEERAAFSKLLRRYYRILS